MRWGRASDASNHCPLQYVNVVGITYRDREKKMGYLVVQRRDCLKMTPSLLLYVFFIIMPRSVDDFPLLGNSHWIAVSHICVVRAL